MCTVVINKCIKRGCNRVVQYSVRSNTILQTFDVRLGTEYYQYSYSVMEYSCILYPVQSFKLGDNIFF